MARPVRQTAREEESQLLGAIVPHGAKTWFFKLTGPSRLLAEEQVGGFIRFVGSIGFSDDVPEWSLPSGWQEEPGSGMRYATLRVPTSERPLEMSVISLPSGEGDPEAYVLLNINRWRDQMGLEPLKQEDLSEAAIRLKREEGDVWVVKIMGHPPKEPMGSGPFAGRGARGGAGAPPAASGAELPFESELPEGWEPAAPGPMQIATYEVRDGSNRASISVSSAGGDLAMNINRWRDQVHLAPLEAPEIEKLKQPIEIDGHAGVLVELVGGAGPERQETILGAIVTVRGRQWFFKLRGDSGLAAREKPHFEEFLKSMKFREK